LKPTLLARGAILIALAIAAFGYRAWRHGHEPKPELLPADTTYWQPTAESRLGGDSTFEFKYRRDRYFVDTKAGTVTRNAEMGPVARLRLTRPERDLIKHAVLASGFFDWPGRLGSPQTRLLSPDIPDESGLYVRAGKLDHEVWRLDTFGRDGELPANRDAKRRMSELEQLIHRVVDAKPEFKKLPDPPPYL